MLETAGTILSSLGVALIFPSYAEKIFAITGATAVCIVCYVLPVALHLKLRSGNAPQQMQHNILDEEEHQVQALLLPGNSDAESHIHVGVQPTQHGSEQPATTLKHCYLYTYEVVVPVVVVLVGVLLSSAALFTTCRQFMPS